MADESLSLNGARMRHAAMMLHAAWPTHTQTHAQAATRMWDDSVPVTLSSVTVSRDRHVIGTHHSRTSLQPGG